MDLRVPPPRALFRASKKIVLRRGRRVRLGERAFTLRKHPPAPRYWRNIAPLIRRTGKDFPEENLETRERNWLLVLQAKAIPHRYFDAPPFRSLFVPPVAAKAALHEILAFEGEKPLPPLPGPKHKKSGLVYGSFLCLLALWHMVRFYAASLFPSLPQNPGAWPAAAGLDAYKVAVLHEWWRSVTALTMHSDAAHLLSNVFFGLIFGVFLCAHTGPGFGVLLIILGGALGNIATAFLRHAAFLSIGFSTAVFAALGLLAGITSAKTARHVLAHKEKNPKKTALRHGLLKSLPPLAAALGLLAMFGGSGAPNVDYLAHVTGLFAGIFLGLAVALLVPGLLELEGRKNRLLQWGCFSAACGLVIFSWRCAF